METNKKVEKSILFYQIFVARILVDYFCKKIKKTGWYREDTSL